MIRSRIALLVLTLVVLCAGCATSKIGGDISTTPMGPSLPIPITNPTIITDLQGMIENLDNAVAVGALPADDPAPLCGHKFMLLAGIEVPAGTTPPKSFTPKRVGPASEGAVIYIRAQQAKAALNSGGLQVSTPCLAVIGQFVLDGAKVVIDAGKGILNPFSALR